MTTLANFLLVVSAKLGLDNSGTIGSSPTADQTLMIGWVNEGVTDVLVRTRCNIQPATMTLTATTYDYTLPTQIMALDEIYITDASTSVWYRMERQSPQELLNLRIGTQFQGSPPVRWYALNGNSTLMVYPTPTAADVLTIYYVPRPTALAAGSDVPSDIPSEWQKAVEYYTLWQAATYMNDAPSQSGQLFMQQYEAELVKLKKASRQKGGLKMSPAVVGRRIGRVVAIGQPSQQYV